MHVRLFPLYKNKSKCPIFKCCHVMLVILPLTSICAVLSGWCRTVFSPLQVHVRVLRCPSKLLRSKLLRKKIARYSVYRETLPNTLFVLGLARIILACLHCSTAPLGWEVLLHLGLISRCPSLCTVNVYASTSIWIPLKINAQQKLQVIYSRGRPGSKPLRCFRDTFTKPRKDLLQAVS